MNFKPTKGKLIVTLAVFIVLILMGNWLLGCDGVKEACEQDPGCSETDIEEGECTEICTTEGCTRMGFWHKFFLTIFLYVLISFFQD